MKKNSLKHFTLIFFLCLGFQLNTFAECTVRNTASSQTTQFARNLGGTTYARQVFTACESGPLQSFMFQIIKSDYEANGARVRIYPNNVVSLPTVVDPYFYGTIDIPGGSGDEILNFIPTEPNAPDLVSGTEYTFEIQMNITQRPVLTSNDQTSTGRLSSGIEFLVEDLDNNAPEDSRVGNFTTESSGAGRAPFALVFAAVMGQPAVAQSPIPTMSEWGLMIFGLLVLNLGVMFIYKRDNVLDIK